jgi:hypothetical protein
MRFLKIITLLISAGVVSNTISSRVSNIHPPRHQLSSSHCGTVRDSAGRSVIDPERTVTMSDRVSAMESQADCEVEGRITYQTKLSLSLIPPRARRTLETAHGPETPQGRLDMEREPPRQGRARPVTDGRSPWPGRSCSGEVAQFVYSCRVSARPMPRELLHLSPTPRARGAWPTRRDKLVEVY